MTDGSATSWEKACGFAAVLIMKQSTELEPLTFPGAFRYGTNNTAEVAAAYQPLFYLVENGYSLRPGGFKVHVIGDSQYLVNGLNNPKALWASSTKHNRMLWTGIHTARRQGLTITAHYVPRDTIELNKFCHNLANAARRQIATVVASVEQLSEDCCVDVRRRTHQRPEE